MADEEKDSHRHVLPGNLLTGPPIFLEGKNHKHMLAGGQGATNVVSGDSKDNHRHTVNGQGTSPPTNTMQDTQLPDKTVDLPERK